MTTREGNRGSNANGNMTYAGNSFMAYNFAYDANNRMTGVTDSNSRSIQYQYNLLGNRTTMTPFMPIARALPRCLMLWVGCSSPLTPEA